MVKMQAIPKFLRRGTAGLLCLCALAGGAAPITLYTEEYPPYNGTDVDSGKVRGLSVDIVNELMARAGLATSGPRVLPWARGLALTAANPDTCLYTAARVPERENLYQWIGPIGRSEWVLFARRDDHLVLRSLEDARPYQIGTYIGDISVTYLGERKFLVQAAASDRVNPQKLLKHRIDLWSVGRLPGLRLLRELGMDQFEPVLTFTQADMYLACSRNMDQADVARLNELLRAMYRDGTVHRIYARHGYEKEAPRLEPAPR